MKVVMINEKRLDELIDIWKEHALRESNNNAPLTRDISIDWVLQTLESLRFDIKNGNV